MTEFIFNLADQDKILEYNVDVIDDKYENKYKKRHVNFNK